MQENNFEKQVQEKLDELSIDPSGAVWQNVAVRIEKRKRGWRMLVLLLCLVTLSTAGLIWWNNPDSITSERKIKPTQQPAKNPNFNEEQIAKKTTPVAAAKTHLEENQEKSAALKSGDHQSAEPLQQLSKKVTASKIFVIDKLKSKGLSEDDQLSNDQAIKARKTKSKFDQAPKTNINVTQAESGDKSEDELVVTAPPVQVDTTATAQLENAFHLITPRVTDQEKVIATDSGNKPEPRTQLVTGEKNIPVPSRTTSSTPHKWKFGLNISAGASTTSNGYLSIVGISSSDENKAYVNSPATGNNSSGNPNNITARTPSPVKTGRGVLLGLFAQKQLSKKIVFQTGLNYKYYSTSMSLGRRVDSFSNFSNSSFYYRTGTQENYKNSYHFVELPVGLQWRISGQDKLPLHLYTGISISRLVHTNALQFDASGIYYTDQSVFKKTQFDFTTSVLIALSKRNKNALLIGPDLNFSLGKMADRGLYQNRNYNYLGIHLQKTFGK